MRGENSARNSVKVQSGGRSPRARGKRHRPGMDGHSERSIPACAGKTPIPHLYILTNKVDPRVRGENMPRTPAESALRGRSPRARGKQKVSLSVGELERSIPACAGKTRGDPRYPGVEEVDPRVRGENHPGEQDVWAEDGRSPRARGKPCERLNARLRRRSIPACAGKTPSGKCRWRGLRVDPRVRGENRYAWRVLRNWTGRSPRARGKPGAGSTPGQCSGSIPACAGKTRPVPGRALAAGVDPRVRGENSRKT